jgi:predicted membrane metal-binding protein
MMTLRLRPVHGQLNDGGFDSQRYALAQHRPLSGGSSPLPRWIPAAVCAPAIWRR